MLSDATFGPPDLTVFCRLDELGLEITGQRVEPERAVLACRVVEPDEWCRRCGCRAVGSCPIQSRAASGAVKTFTREWTADRRSNGSPEVRAVGRHYVAVVSGGKRPVLGAAAAAAVTAAVVVGLTLTTGVDWFYDRPVTTVAVMVTVVLATLITRRLLPRAWRPAGVLPVLVAAVSAYVFLRVSVSAGWTEAVDHGVLERLEGEVDDFPTWAFAGAGAASVLCFVTLLNRRSGGRSGDDEPA